MTMIDPSKLTNLSTEDETANGWDEARLAAALAKLQATHVQVHTTSSLSLQISVVSLRLS